MLCEQDRVTVHLGRESQMTAFMGANLVHLLLIPCRYINWHFVAFLLAVMQPGVSLSC